MFSIVVLTKSGRRQGPKIVIESRGRRESRVVPAPDANAELVASMQRRHDKANSNEVSNNDVKAREFFSGPLVAAEKKYDDEECNNKDQTGRRRHTGRRRRKHDLSRSTNTTKQSYMDGHGYMGKNTIHFSGLLGASNVRDHHIQEAARRARLDQVMLAKLQSEPTTNHAACLVVGPCKAMHHITLYIVIIYSNSF
ncbi:uncharacterized protein LOC143571861 [Bidens hawaiensis]|uniref:uncharacterized protein LOC143571861 n=1 Tax=Bidens hawaiensis TaxID=980011 RepID=UPI004049923F